jgi:hypothetical protein
MKPQKNKTVIAILVIVGLLYVGNLIIDNPYTHSLVNFYLNEKILKKLPIRAEYQSMKVSLLPPSFNIYGLKVHSSGKDGIRGEELVVASSLVFQVSLWSVFMAHPQIGDIEVTDLVMSWPPPADFMEAVKNLGTPSDKNKPGDPLWPPLQPPPVSSLKISNASLKATFDGLSVNVNQDPSEVTRLAADGLNLDVEIHDWKSFKLNLNSPKTTLTDQTTSYIESASVKLRGEMQGNKFKTRKLEVRSPRLEIDGSSDIEIINKPKSRVIDAINVYLNSNQFQADSSIIGSFLDIPGNRGKLAGSAKTTLFIPITSKKPVGFTTNGKLQSHDARFYDFRLYETASDFSVDLKKFTLSNIDLKIGEKTVATGSGSIGFDKLVPFDFKLTPTDLPFKDLLGIFNVDFDVLNFDMTSPLLAITGTGDPFLMSVQSATQLKDFKTPGLDYDHTRYPNSPTCDLDLLLKVDSNELQINRGAGHCYGPTQSSKFSLNMSGATSFDPKSGLDILLRSDEFNPSPLAYFAQASLAGRGAMQTRIHGAYDNVKVDVETKINDTVIGSTAVGEMNAKLTVHDEFLEWKDFKIRFDGGGNLLSPSGKLAFDDDLNIDFSANARLVDHGVIGSMIRDMTDGKQSLEFVARSVDIKMKGPALKPLTWQGSLELDIENARDRNYFYGKSLKGVIKGTPTGLATDELEILTAGTKADIKFNHVRSERQNPSDILTELGLGKNDRFEIEGKLTPISGAGDEIRLIPILGRYAAEYGISAQTSGDFKFAGNLSKQTGIARLRTSKTKITNNPVSDIVSSIVVDGGKLDIMAEQGGSALKARVNLDFSKDEIPFSWYISARNADFRPWLPSVMSQDARNYAYLTATWTLQGRMDRWWESKGELDLKDLRIRYYSAGSGNGQRFDFRSAHASRIYFSGNSWIAADNLPLTISSSFGELKFGLRDHRPPHHLGVLIDGKMDIEALKLFISDVETASGSLAINGAITGSIDKPNVDVNVRNVDTESRSMDLGLLGFRPTFQNIELNANIKYDGVHIRRLRANKGNGVIAANGFIARPGSGEDTDLSINLENAAFLYPFPIVKYFDSSIDGQIKISGTARPWTAAGRVVIRRARSNRDFDLREAIIEGLRSQSTGDSTESITPTVNLDINIGAERSISFSSRSVQAELSTDLRIAGNNLTPSIIGLVDIPKGRFFYKRDFEIKRGLINFDDPIQVDPSLDISATSDVASYRVAINISGRASSPMIDFTVDPATRPDGQALSKMEIIGLLSRGSLPDAQSGRNTSESAAAAEALNLLAGQVEDTVQKIFDLSGQNVIRQVYIDTYAPEGGTPVARFNLPLNITDDFDVILKVDQTTLKVSSEYSLHDSISLTGGIESSNDQSGVSSKGSGAPADTGVDLKFKFAFP